MTQLETTALLFVLELTAFTAAMVVAFLLGRRLTGFFARWAEARGIVSHVNERSSHTVPKPRLGGVGLALAFGLCSGGFLLAGWLAPHEFAPLAYNPSLVTWLGLGWALMFIVGLIDDVTDLPALVKLGLMTLAALAPAAGGGAVPRIIHAHVFSTRMWLALAVVVTVLWILFFTNGFNFMDGMDGFAANFGRFSAVTMFLSLFLTGYLEHRIQQIRAEAYLLPILAMACWGFLYWNRPPSKVFMGDGGSLSVGYLLAVFVVLGQRGQLGVRLSGLTSLTILLPFIFDVCLTLARRARLGHNLLQAHREHLYQRLMRTGLSHAQVLRMNMVRFAACDLLALMGTFMGLSPAHRTMWESLGLVLALGVMIQYWLRTLSLERRARAG